MANYGHNGHFRNRVDFDAIHDAADVRTVAETYLEAAREPGRYVCPSCGKGNVTVKAKVWACWSCEARMIHGRDAIGLVSLATGMSRIDAAKRLAEDLGMELTAHGAKPLRTGQRVVISPTPPEPPEPEPYELESWQVWMSEALLAAHVCLMGRSSEASREAWYHLTVERGLEPETIEAERLGLNREWRLSEDALPGRRCFLPPGIVIPWHAGPPFSSHNVEQPVWCGANVRQFHKPLRDKYVMATGTRRHWLYPCRHEWEGWTGPVVVVEGEFDAMLGNQEFGGLLPVVTLGGATCGPSDTFDTLWLSRCSHLFVAADADEAGQKCRSMWRNFSPRRFVSIDPPCGKDLSEAHAAGDDLLSWIMRICEGHGMDRRQLDKLYGSMVRGRGEPT